MSLQRIHILLEQRRWEPALNEISRLLEHAPEETLLLSYRARCLAELERFEEAEEGARHAVATDPGDDFAHYTLGLILYDRGYPKQALESLYSALELEPRDPRYYGQLSLIQAELKNWREALDLADRGLELDASSPLCLNARARALSGMGRASDARVDLHSHLAEDPDNPLTHANLGWLALEQGESKKALEHFETALTADPEMAWARAGLLEALRSRYPLYKIILGYFLWLAKLPSNTQWAVILGGYFAYRFGLNMARSNPDAAPFLTPFLVLYILFVYLTWTAQTATNVLLRFNRYGRRLLDEREMRETTLVGATWLGAAACFVAVPFTDASIWALGAILLLQAVFISTCFRCPQGWPRKTMIGVAVLMGVLGVGGYGVLAAGVKAGGAMLGIYFTLVLFVLLGSNYLVGVRVKR